MPRRFWLPVALGILASGPLSGQTITASRVDAATFHLATAEERRNVFAANLALGPEERERFWPIYDDYEKERAALEKERFSLLQRYAQSYSSISDDQAMALVLASGRLQVADVQLRLKYAEALRRKMSGRVAARFFQIDDYVTTAMRMNSLTGVPLVAPGR